MFFLWISKQNIQVPVGPDKEPVASADHHLNLQVDPPPVEPSDETQLQPATVTLRDSKTVHPAKMCLDS